MTMLTVYSVRYMFKLLLNRKIVKDGTLLTYYWVLIILTCG